jgi:hypothetical protein
MHEVLTTLIDSLQARGVPVRFNTDLDASMLGNRPTLFTGHLSALVSPHLRPYLAHRGLYMLHTVVPHGAITDDSVDTWYVPDAQYWFGRVSVPQRFDPDLRHEAGTIVCIEVPEGQWGPDVDFTARSAELCRQLAEAGIVRAGTRLAFQQTFEPRVYPLYRRGWVRQWRAAMREVGHRTGVLPIGRQGLYLHCNIDHSIQIAHDAVDHLLEGGNSQSWADSAERYLDVRVRD